jgi:hypothetical protein
MWPSVYFTALCIRAQVGNQMPLVLLAHRFPKCSVANHNHGYIIPTDPAPDCIDTPHAGDEASALE